MPIHPQAQAFLDLGATLGLPDISEQGAYMARANGHSERDLSGSIESGVTIENPYFTGPTADLPLHV